MAPPIYKHHLNYNTKTTPVTKNRIGKKHQERSLQQKQIRVTLLKSLAGN